MASQQTGEVFVDCGAARFNFDEKNDLNYFVRTITTQGEQRIYWGKDLSRALEEAGAKVGECITATRVASKPGSLTLESGKKAFDPGSMNNFGPTIRTMTIERRKRSLDARGREFEEI